MTLVWIALALALLLVLWVAPCVVAAAALFCGRKKPPSAEKWYYIPYREEMDRCAAFLEGLSPRRVQTEARDGVKLAASWYDGGFGRAVVMLHGYKASAAMNFSISAKAFWDRGWDLLLVDQRAHGESGGRISAFGLLEQYDLLCWIDWLREHTATEKLVVYGVSMGCAAAAYASDKADPSFVRAMALDCGLCSPRGQLIDVAVKRGAPWQIMMPLIRLFLRLLCGADINAKTEAPLSRTAIPAVFLHGTADDTVPVSCSERNYAACASDKLLLTVPDAAHTMAFPAADAETREKLFAFIEKHL